MNVEEWARDALQELQIQAAEQPVTADQIATAIRYANRLMASYDYLGLGYSVVNDAGDEVTIPPYAEEWAVSALAARIAPQFVATDTIALVKDNERKAFQRLLMQHQELQSARFPSTLPLGSGNECGHSNIHFYPEEEDNQLITETGQNILAEDDT